MAKARSYVVDDVKQAEGALAEMAGIDRKLAQIEVDLNEEIDAAKKKALSAKTPLEARRKELDGAVKTWALMNKSVLFGERKSLDLGFGIIGFQATSRIQQMNGVSAGDTLEKLKKFNFTNAIRITETVNKEVMETWPEERLELVGVVRRESNFYFCKINQEKLIALRDEKL